MNCRKGLFFSSLLLMSATLSAYDVVERYKIIDDKLKTEAILRPIDHDFIFDLSASMNKNLMDVMDDVDNTTKFQGTSAQKLAEAQRILTKYNKTEQTVKINAVLGIPLPSFSAWDVKVKPNLRGYGDVGANIGIRPQRLTLSDVINYFSEDIPAELKSFILGLSAGDDVIAQCTASGTLSASTRAFCATQPTGKYIVPNLTQDVATISIFAKADVKLGLFNDYTYGEHFFGHLNLYSLWRTDIFQVVDANQIASGQSIEFPKKKNTESSLQADYRFGYKNSNYSAFASLEELKIADMTDADAGSKAHRYDYDPLMRLQADALYKLSAFSLQPFVGVHKRSGYGFDDGVYGGATAGAYVWGDRLGLQMRAMFDKQYMILTPRMKLWLMQVEYSLRNPLKSTDSDVKLTALHSLDFRIFF